VTATLLFPTRHLQLLFIVILLLKDWMTMLYLIFGQDVRHFFNNIQRLIIIPPKTVLLTKLQMN
jgi:hypothetical protein